LGVGLRLGLDKRLGFVFVSCLSSASNCANLPLVCACVCIYIDMYTYIYLHMYVWEVLCATQVHVANDVLSASNKGNGSVDYLGAPLYDCACVCVELCVCVCGCRCVSCVISVQFNPILMSKILVTLPASSVFFFFSFFECVARFHFLLQSIWNQVLHQDWEPN